MATKKKTEGEAAAPLSFEWAQNELKLRQAIAHVNSTTDHKAGTQEHHDAVKDRYVQLKGFVHGMSKNRAGKSGRVVNVADDDGSEEIENDEADGDE